jgi:hypothetical protein
VHLPAVSLDFAEKLIPMARAGRKLRAAETHSGVAFGREAELVAVHVVAVGDGELDFDRAVDGACAKAERLLGLKQFVRFPEKLRRRRTADGEQYEECEKALHVLVSAATQSR